MTQRSFIPKVRGIYDFAGTTTIYRPAFLHSLHGNPQCAVTPDILITKDRSWIPPPRIAFPLHDDTYLDLLGKLAIRTADTSPPRLASPSLVTKLKPV